MILVLFVIGAVIGVIYGLFRRAFYPQRYRSYYRYRR